MTKEAPQDPIARGLAMMEEIYGPKISQAIAAMPSSPFNSETIEHLFGEIWGRDHLSVRDRRLLVLGATATMGRPDLVATQVRGARLRGELTDAQLDEAVLLLAFYVGWGNAAAVQQGVLAARHEP